MKQMKTEAQGKNKEYRPTTTTTKRHSPESYVIRLLIVISSKLFLVEGMSVPAPSLTAPAA